MVTIKQVALFSAALALGACDNVEWVSYPDDEPVEVEAAQEEAQEPVVGNESAAEEGTADAQSAETPSEAPALESAISASDDEPSLFTP